MWIPLLSNAQARCRRATALCAVLCVAATPLEPLPTVSSATADTALPASQANPTLPSGAQEILTSYFSTLCERGPKEANPIIGNKLPGAPSAEMSKLNQQVVTSFGRPNAYQLFNAQILSDRYAEALVLTYHSQTALAWRIKFYLNNNESWTIVGLKVQSDHIADFLQMREIEYDVARSKLDAGNTRDMDPDKR